jgi:predicted TIM-barrel fold metal-dependent hydrolase
MRPPIVDGVGIGPRVRSPVSHERDRRTPAGSGTLVLPFVVVTHAVIDSHLHVWDGTAAGRDPGPMKIGYSPQATASVELFMDYMDEAGVERAVFVQPWFYHWNNRYMVSALRRFPGRFRGVGVIDPRGRNAPGALRRWRAEGVTGIRLRPLREGERPRRGPWFGTDETLPLWEAMAETGTIACVLNAGTDLGRLPAILERFPSLRVVVDHLNSPVPARGLGQPVFRALLDLARHPQVHVKLSGFHHWCRERYPYRDGLPFAEAAVRAFGADRCMWGSDFPHVLAGCGYVRNRHLLPREATFLSKEQLGLVMGGTAERLWFG